MTRKPRSPILQTSELVACPRCRLGMEVGKNPDGVVWHECRPKLAVEDVIRKALAQEEPISDEQWRDLSRRAALAFVVQSSDPSALMELVRMGQPAVTPGRHPKGASKGLAAFLAGAEVEKD